MKTADFKPFKLAGFIVLPELVGLGAGAVTAKAISEWYSRLTKPTFTPPGFIFAPVWTVLYLLMGVSAYLIWQKRKQINIKPAALIYITQLTLNFAWSILFFGLKNPFFALVDIILLWLLIIFMFACFYRIDKKAGLLQLPYLLWVSFASMLNLSIWLLNPSP